MLIGFLFKVLGEENSSEKTKIINSRYYKSSGVFQEVSFDIYRFGARLENDCPTPFALICLCKKDSLL